MRFELLPQTFKMFKAIVAAAVVAAAGASPAGPPPPAPYHAPAPAYKPAPHPYKPEKLPPQPFAYEYGVKDGYSGADFAKNENQDASGNVAGSYVVHLPDGRVQTVTYTADHYNGYVADVKYEGVPQYPTRTKRRIRTTPSSSLQASSSPSLQTSRLRILTQALRVRRFQ